MYRVGLTGGIASGKSAVAEAFRHLGVPVVDADVCAREVVEPGREGLRAIVERFGTAVLTAEGRLDRAALRRQVFGDPAARHWLERLVHPLIRRCMDERLARAAATRPPPVYAVEVIPLLVETGQQDRFDRVLVVDVDAETQVRRVVARDGGDAAQARAILAAQADRQQRLAAADDVLVNDDDLQALVAKVGELHQRYLQRFAQA